MAGIGGVTCSRVIGARRKPSMRMDIWQIPGLNGYNVHKLGTGNGETTWKAVHFGTEGSLQAWYQNLSDTVGTIVSIVNEQGATATNQLIQAVGEPTKRTAWDGVGNSMRWEVNITSIDMST